MPQAPPFAWTPRGGIREATPRPRLPICPTVLPPSPHRYVVPYALYEHGVMLAAQGRAGGSAEQLREALSMLQAAKDDFKDYNYEVRLGVPAGWETLPPKEVWMAMWMIVQIALRDDSTDN